MKIPSCSECDRPAAWTRPWDRKRLCLLHFNTAFLKRVQKTINKYRLFERNDTIAVGISGGKDSVVLLDTIVRLQKKHQTNVIAITIDEGISGYREDGLKYAKMAAERAGVEHVVYSFEERFGSTLDETLTLLDANTNGKRLGACSYCGIFRRKLLNEAARTVGATKLATGHNADDEAQTVVMNLFRGDILKTLRSDPVPNIKHPLFVPRVKPFRWTTEQEIVLYAHFNNLPYQEMPCPNAVEAHRGIIRDIMTNYMEHTPDALFSILTSADKLFEMANAVTQPKIKDKIVPLKPQECIKCGEPSATRMCKACQVQDMIEVAKKITNH